MRFLSLFSGIEAATCAWSPLGWDCAAVAEVEPFPCALLKHHYPNVPNLGDVTKITADQINALGLIDLVCGGFPCQDLSVAGKRKGLSNADGTSTRSGLFFDAMRIADWANPRWLFIENVPGMFSSNAGRDFAAVVGEMAGCEFDVPRDGWRNAGVVAGPKGLVEWSVMDAQYHGLAQRRKRVFIVRDSGDWASRPPIFLEPYRLQGYPAPSRKAGQSPAGTISARTTGGGGLGTDFELGGGLVPSPHAAISHALKSRDGKGPSSNGDGAILVPMSYGIRTANTSSNGWGIQEEATHTLDGAMGIAVAFAENSRSEIRLEGGDGQRIGALTSGGGKPGQGVPCIAFTERMSATQSATTENLAPSMGALNPTAVAFKPGSIARNAGPAGESHLCPTLRKEMGNNQPAVRLGMQVRRLIPTECERLMGFPDGYTNVPHRGKPAADGPRYKALGNSWAVPNVRWIGRRIDLVAGLMAEKQQEGK